MEPKPIIQSMTAWGVAIFALAAALDASGVLSGATDRLAEYLEILGAAVTAIGLRRAQGGGLSV